MTDTLITIVIGSIITPMLAYLIAKVSSYIDEKLQTVKNERFQKALQSAQQELETAVYKAIMTTQETYVAALKQDGAFSAEDAKLAFEKSVELTKQIMSAAGLSILKDAEIEITEAIRAEIESQLPTIKTDISGGASNE